MKQAIKVASIAVSVVVLASLALCQEARVYREGNNWVQEMTGTMGTAKNLRVKLASGSVKVQGRSQAGITFIVELIRLQKRTPAANLSPIESARL